MFMPIGTLLLVFAGLWSEVSAHGRLLEPPARSSMWRKGFQDVPKDYNDNELFCGGFAYQWNQMDGKCGVCGDPYGGPFDHEFGGRFYTDKIAGHYSEGQDFTAEVQLTASHKGWFEFRVCEASRTSRVTHDCLNRYPPLEKADGTGSRYMVTIPGGHTRYIPLRLPMGLTCAFCVLQWKYHTGNNWGTDENGLSGVGLGPQEEFYGCANIAIQPAGGTVPAPKPTGSGSTPGQKLTPSTRPRPPHSTSGPTRAAKLTPTPSSRPSPTSGPTRAAKLKPTPSPRPSPTSGPTRAAKLTPTPSSRPSPTKGPTRAATLVPKPATPEPAGSCRAADGPWKVVAGMDAWCLLMCARGFCPPSHCTCA